SLRRYNPNTCVYLFLLHDPATPEIYTLSLHDALPIYDAPARLAFPLDQLRQVGAKAGRGDQQLAVTVLPAVAGEQVEQLGDVGRSEEHTSELQSLAYLVCRLLLEKKKKIMLNKRFIMC